MQNQTEYEIKKLSELNRSQVKQAIALFVDGFYYIYEMAVSKDKALLQQLFIDAFDYDMVFVCLHEERIVGFLGLGNSIKRCIKKNPLVMLSGLGYQIVMKLEVDKAKKGN